MSRRWWTTRKWVGRRRGTYGISERVISGERGCGATLEGVGLAWGEVDVGRGRGGGGRSVECRTALKLRTYMRTSNA